MEQIIVTRLNGTTYPLASRHTATAIKSAKQTWELLGSDVVNVEIESPYPQVYSIGDKITIFGRVYKLNRMPKAKKTGAHMFTYDLEFEGIQYDLLRATYDLTIDTTNNQLQDIQADTLTGNLNRFATVLIANANRVFPGKWALGSCPDTETLTLTFGESDNCLSVLQNLCSESNFHVEFQITENSGVYYIQFLYKVGQIIPYTFEYGRGKGLYSLDSQSVDSSNIITRLKVYGSTANITSKYRASRLCLPGCSKAQSYIEKPEAVAAYGIFEATKYFDNIKPTFNGTVTGLVSGSVVKFVDTAMFDLNALELDGVTPKYLMPGVAPKVHFNTGNLAGYEFEVEAYDTATHTFTLIKQTDENGYEFPSSTSVAFQFDLADEYKILDVALPEQYVTDAENRLFTEGDTYYDQNSQPKVQYGLSITKDYLKSLYPSGATVNIFQPGDYIHVVDADIGVDKSLRIKSLTRNILDEYDYSLTISDTVSTNITNRVISELIDHDKIIAINNLKDPARARANWRSSREVLNMVFDPEGDYYTDKIKPESIDTVALSVGAKSMQFGLTNTVLQPNYNGNKNVIKVTGGVLTHYTIDEESARSWVLADNTTTFTSDTQAYYIYAKCERVGTAGSIIFSTEQIKVEQDANYYHFWIGVVNSVDIELQARSVALSYGFTMINGRFIKTGRVQSADGQTYFDLDTGQIAGKISFLSGSSGYNNLSDKPDLSVFSLQDDVDALIANLQAQIDGQIMTWFDTYVPTLSNAPATSWTTDTDKDKHLGDLFYNKSTGLGYRFSKIGSVYSWEILKDTDVALALANAAAAQDTADGKRRVFVAQPTNADAYDVGDLWVNATYSPTYNNDLLKCKTSKQAGASFSIAHWEKASKYTDDAAANAAAAAAANAQTAANTANSLLADIASDGKLTPSEKQAVKKEWDVIPTEMGTIMNQADNYGITYYDLEDRFQELADYINPLLANLTVTSDIDGATFRQKFKNYYDQKNSVLSAISIRAKELADLAQQTADSIAIGGSNLLPNSESPTGFRTYQGSTLTVTNNYSIPEFGATKAVRLQATGGTSILKTYVIIFPAMENGRVASLSFYVKNLSTADLVLVSNLMQKTTTVGAGVALRVKWEGLVGNGVGELQIQLRAPTTGQNVDAAIWRIKFENGNRCTDWSPAHEDIDAQLVVLKAKTEGRTVIEGGVVESELIMLGTGGICGLSGIPVDTNNNPLPSRWAGGTYQEAIDKKANIVEWFNGDAKFGDLWIDAAGSIAIKDTSGVIKVLLTKNNITTLAAIAGSTQNSTINNAANNNNIEGTTTVLLANSIVVNNNNSTVTVSCVISSSITRDDKLMKCNGIADVSIYLYNTTTGNDVYIAKLHVVAADVYSASDSLNVGVAVTMPAGTYKLKIIYSHDNYSNCIFNSSISASTTTVVFNGAKQRLEIGKNGIGIIGDSNNYSWMGLDGGVYKSVEKVESGGVYDKPGVLASATVSSTGSSSNKWGGRVGNSSRSSTGVYVISHTIGHVNYNIVACANQHDRHVIYTSKETKSVTINVKNGSGTLVDQQFDYIIVGNNQ